MDPGSAIHHGIHPVERGSPIALDSQILSQGGLDA